jgi:hypothetical protein
VVAVPAARWEHAGAAVAARFSPTRVAVSRPVVVWLCGAARGWSRKNCDFAAGSQERAVRGAGWGCAARVAVSRQPHKS